MPRTSFVLSSHILGGWNNSAVSPLIVWFICEECIGLLVPIMVSYRVKKKVLKKKKSLEDEFAAEIKMPEDSFDDDVGDMDSINGPDKSYVSTDLYAFPYSSLLHMQL